MEMEYGVFGEDILVEILKRLPKKYQFRFRCVSKGWLHLLSDRTRLSPTTTTDTVLLLQYILSPNTSRDLLQYSLSPNASRDLSTITFLRVTNDDSASVVHSLGFSLHVDFRPIDSCNGLLLFGAFNRWDSVSSYLVYHPATKRSAAVPLPPCEDESFLQVGFAFDGHHYQLICLRLKALDHLLVFSSQTGEWRVKHVMIPHPAVVRHASWTSVLPSRSLFLKGAVHWLLGGFLFIYHLKDEHLEAFELPAYVGYVGFRTAFTPRHCIWNSEGRLNYCYGDQNRIYIYVLCMSDWEDYNKSGRPDFQWRLKHMGAFTIPIYISWGFSKHCAYEGGFENEDPLALSRYQDSIVLVGDPMPMPEFQPCAFDDDFEIVYLKSHGRLFAYKLKTGVTKEVRINTFGVSTDNKSSISVVFPYLYT